MSRLGNIHKFYEKHVIYVLILLILIQLFVVTIFGLYKESYHLDELFTFGLSNSYFITFISYEDVSMKWLGPDFYNDYFTVQTNESFAYDSVYYNQVNDVHPPFYYYIIHTVCSFFPNMFSKWFGIGVNIIFLAGTVVVLFLLARLINNKNSLALIICASYGFSAGAISNAVFIRMYMMLTFFTVLTTYLHGLLILKNKHIIAIIFLVMIVNILGFLTQYLFVVYAFFIVCGYVIYLVKNKKWGTMLIYTAAMLGCAIICIYLFPECIQHIFSGNRGIEAINNFSKIGDFFIRILIFVLLLLISTSSLQVLLTTILATVFICFKNSKISSNKSNRLFINVKNYFYSNLSNEKKFICIIVIISTLLAFLIISKIAPYYEYRYISFLLPNINIFSIILIYIIFLNLLENKNYVMKLLIIIICGFTIISYLKGDIKYLYSDRSNDFEIIMSEYYSYDAYCFATKTENMTMVIPIISHHDRSCYVESAEDMLTMLENNRENNPIVIYFPRWDQEGTQDTTVLSKIIENSEYTSYIQLIGKEESGLSTKIYLLK
ncbi:hypothetical protein [Sedimentibacter sp. B4]|uniref:hypothetical protein n=1 Tax=Sedimentibacter sp. B4 TaxID=304766 RepID=UPI00030D07DB|nr:hypothetical protein [Sedimentibacter sp. B4]